MTKPEKLLQASDHYEHDGAHRPIGVALGAVVGYWYGQPDWRPRGGYENPGNLPPSATYNLDRLDDCCTAYGFRKGYRFKNGDYSDSQTQEEIDRYTETRKSHMHNPLTVARGAVIGYAYGRAGKIDTLRAPTDLIRTCCAMYGFGQGKGAGRSVFFFYATEAEKERYFGAARIERYKYVWD